MNRVYASCVGVKTGSAASPLFSTTGRSVRKPSGNSTVRIPPAAATADCPAVGGAGVLLPWAAAAAVGAVGAVGVLVHPATAKLVTTTAQANLCKEDSLWLRLAPRTRCGSVPAPIDRG